MEEKVNKARKLYSRISKKLLEDELKGRLEVVRQLLERCRELSEEIDHCNAILDGE